MIAGARTRANQPAAAAILVAVARRGAFFHDERFATLGDVVSHSNRHLSLGLTEAQSRDLLEGLESL